MKLPINQSFENEYRISVNKTCGVFINYVIMEETCDKNPTMQTKINRNPEGENEQLMQNNIKKLHV
jgi:hypothetical protein